MDRRQFLGALAVAGVTSACAGGSDGDGASDTTTRSVAPATPAALMRAWMSSPGHRRNVLKAAYRELGFGISVGTPSHPGTGVTVAVEFGARMAS